MNLVDMKMSKQEVKEYNEVKADAPEYPYGLRLHLDHDQLKKLGIGTPNVQQTLIATARVKVCSVDSYETAESGLRTNVSLQITDLALAPDVEPENHAANLYGGANKA